MITQKRSLLLSTSPKARHDCCKNKHAQAALKVALKSKIKAIFVEKKIDGESGLVNLKEFFKK